MRGDGHTAYGQGSPDCIDSSINTYLLDGKLPAKGTTCVQDLPFEQPQAWPRRWRLPPHRRSTRSAGCTSGRSRRELRAARGARGRAHPERRGAPCRSRASITSMFVVSDLARSLEFYLGVFGPLGVREAYRYPSHRGTEEILPALRRAGARAARGGRRHGTATTRSASSTSHVLWTPGRNSTNTRCVKLGVNVQFPPAEDRDIPGYWELFVLDPDGLRIEVAYYPPQDPH